MSMPIAIFHKDTADNGWNIVPVAYMEVLSGYVDVHYKLLYICQY